MLSEEWTSEMVLPSAHPTTPTPEAPEMQVMSPLRLKFCMVAFFTKPKSPILLPETYGKEKPVTQCPCPSKLPVKGVLTVPIGFQPAISVMSMSFSRTASAEPFCSNPPTPLTMFANDCNSSGVEIW